MHTDTSGLWPMFHTEDSQYWTRTFSIIGKTVNIQPTAEVFVHGTEDRRLCHIVCVYNLLYIFLHELLVKVRPQSVVDEASFFLVAVATSTVLKHDVIIPPVHNALSCNQLGNRLLHATQSDTTMVEATRKKVKDL